MSEAKEKKIKSAPKKKVTKTSPEKDIIRLRVRVRAYENKILDASVKQIIDTALRHDAKIMGPTPLPTEIKKYTVNRSPFIYKNTREQFEIRMHKRLIDIINPGAKTIEVSLPHVKYAISAYYIIMPAEVSSNMARYDGIKYGYSVVHDAGHKDLASVYSRSRSGGLGREVKRRVMLGTYVLSAGYYDAYYKKAQQMRTKIIEDFKSAFGKADVLVTPTSPTTAFKFGEKTQDPLSMYLADVFTVPVNLAGLPAISVPCGLSDSLPVGLQFIAPWFEEKMLFNIGEEFELLC